MLPIKAEAQPVFVESPTPATLEPPLLPDGRSFPGTEVRRGKRGVSLRSLGTSHPSEQPERKSWTTTLESKYEYYLYYTDLRIETPKNVNEGPMAFQ